MSLNHSPIQWNVELSVSIENLNRSIEDFRNAEIGTEGFVNKVTDLFRHTFNTLRLINLRSNKEESENSYLLALDERPISKLNKSKLGNNYIYLMDYNVPVPKGMAVTWVEYVTMNNELANAMPIVATLADNIRSDIGRIVSTQDGIRDTTIFTDKVYVESHKKIKLLVDKWATMRKGVDLTSERKYSEVFRNNDELMKTIEIVRGTNKILNTISRKKIAGNIDSTMVYVENLMEQSKNGYSKPLVLKIANGVKAVADSVEILAAVTYDTRVVNTALDECNRVVSKLV